MNEGTTVMKKKNKKNETRKKAKGSKWYQQAIDPFLFLATCFSFTIFSTLHSIHVIYNPKERGVGMLGKVEEVPVNMTLACVRASRAVKTCSVCFWGR